MFSLSKRRKLLEFGILKSAFVFVVQVHFVIVFGYIAALILLLLAIIFGTHYNYEAFHLEFMVFLSVQLPQHSVHLVCLPFLNKLLIYEVIYSNFHF